MASPTFENPAASIDDPAMRSAGRDLLSLALIDARNRTLQLLAQFEAAGAASLVPPCREAMELPAWLGGHIAWLAEAWIGRNPQRGLGAACPPGAPRLASIEPMADRWFDPVLAPHDSRWLLALPDLNAVRAYLLDTLESTLELLEKTPEDDASLYFFRAALFHEDMRGEQLMTLAQATATPIKLAAPEGAAAREPLLVPASHWQLGWQGNGFAQAIERGGAAVDVPEFEIDAQPVNWAQFVEFVGDGGYDRRECWSAEGWHWLQAEAEREGRRGPRYVDQIGVGSGAVLQTRFGRATRMGGTQSAMHVSWWEAEAWARWAGRRLPTEVEWELAAHSAARRGFRWGEVHEWTAGTLRPWPGFQPDAWTAGTPLDAEPMFGRARVLRGGSFATPPRLRHPKARHFALPHRDDGFIGFRTCAA